LIPDRTCHRLISDFFSHSVKVLDEVLSLRLFDEELLG
jgi:hypothetical protein